MARPLTKSRRLRYRLEVLLVGALTRLLPLLPHRGLVAVGRMLGLVAYRLLSKQRRIALANLDIAFGTTKSAQEKEQIARRSMQQFALTILSLFWSPRLNQTNLNEVVEMDAENLAYAKSVIGRGKGVICITLHFGNWEVLGLASGLLGLPLHVVTETMRNTGMEDLFLRLRSRTGNRIVPQKGAATKLYKALRRGECIVLLIDLNAPEEGGGMWLDFFGLPVFNNVAAAGLALRTGAVIASALAYPLPDGRYRIVYGPEIPYTATGNDAADIERISHDCLAHCERVIREHPEAWLWSYKRWKHSPTPDLSRYPHYASFHSGIAPQPETPAS